MTTLTKERLGYVQYIFIPFFTLTIPVLLKQTLKTAAHYAAAHDNVHALRLLLDNGADVNARDAEGHVNACALRCCALRC